MTQTASFSTMTAGPKLVSLSLAALLALAGILTADPALAGGKRADSRCKNSKSCASGFCVRAQPSDRFGSCCQPDTCAEQNAQCGTIDNGCGAETDCGGCEGSCVDNQCLPPTTSSTTTSTTSTTSTSTSTTTSTLPETTTTSTTTTTDPGPQHECTADIQCGSGCCDFVDPDRWQCKSDSECCLGCWLMCYNACGCAASPGTCNVCMSGCVPANCGCPYY